jgi:hypothetical protein
MVHFNLDMNWMRVFNFTFRLLYPREKFPLPTLIKRLDGLQKRSGRRAERKFPALAGLKLLGRLSRSQSLYRLRYPGSLYYFIGTLIF